MERPRPEVTVTDPRQPAALVAVEEPAPPALGRRGVALLCATALAGVAALVTADVARDRRDAAEQRRLDGVVQVALGPTLGGWSSTHGAATGTGTVEGSVRLLNAGPRDVRVTSAEMGPLRSTAARTLDAGGGGVVELRGTFRCPSDGSPPPPEPEAQELHVRLATPAGPREVSLDGPGLPLGSLDEGVQGACGFPSLRDSLRLTGTVVRTDGRTALLRVQVANEGRRPVRLLSLIPARGLVVLSIDGGATELPVLLPAGSPSRRRFDLRVGVVCVALVGVYPLRPFEEMSAVVEDEDEEDIAVVREISQDPDRQLRQLAGRTCSPG